MRRFARTMALAAAAVAAVGIGTSTASASGAAPAAAAPCTGTVAITQLAWSPATVVPGQTPLLSLTATNCTNQPVAAAVEITYRILGPGSASGIPQGCVVEDPIFQQETFAANGSFTTGGSYPALATCTATGVVATGTVFGPTGTVLAQSTAQVTIQQPLAPVACRVTYTVQSQWQGGFTAALSIADTGEQAFSGWKLTFTFGGDQKIGTVWGASAAQSGETVTLTNLGYDAAIAAGATLSNIGMTGTWTVSDAAASGFAVDGVACS